MYFQNFMSASFRLTMLNCRRHLLTSRDCYNKRKIIQTYKTCDFQTISLNVSNNQHQFLPRILSEDCIYHLK